KTKAVIKKSTAKQANAKPKDDGSVAVGIGNADEALVRRALREAADEDEGEEEEEGLDVGDRVLALWEEDGEWYDAVVEEFGDETVVVWFEEWECSAELPCDEEHVVPRPDGDADDDDDDTANATSTTDGGSSQHRILTRRLEEDPTLQGITHVIVDEVHERSVESDFLLMVLRDLLVKRPELRLVLMSATLDADLFASYFDVRGRRPPTVRVPGRTFPVTQLFLEDALELTRHKAPAAAEECRLDINDGKPYTRQEFVDEYGGLREWDLAKPAPAPKLSGPQPSAQPTPEPEERRLSADGERYTKAEFYSFYGSYKEWDAAAQQPPSKPPKAKAKAGGGDGGGVVDGVADAILVFLPGFKEIQTLHEALLATRELGAEPQRSWVLPLHGLLPPEEQRKVFERPTGGARKIVLATNIAETAITVDDVSYVVDCGRMKEKRFDAAKRMESLEDCLISRANAKQRRGRAGRVRPGVAFHLITRHTHDDTCDGAQLPEIKRIPLERLVLTIKRLGYKESAAAVCARLLDPPERASVGEAVRSLVAMEAIDQSGGGEELTPLGAHLACLPTDARLGKFILLGAIFGVVDEALTIAATLSHRTPFIAPFDKRDAADAAKRSFSVGQSDHLAALNAYRQFDSLPGNGKYDFARANFLGIKETRFESKYLVFAEKVKTTQIYVRDSSPVSPYALMLFGGGLTLEGAARGARDTPRTEATLAVDTWIRFRVPYRMHELILDIRQRLRELLMKKIERPEVELSAAGKAIMEAVTALLGAPPPDL
ncbi:ATP-dependent RNA helicase dhx57, partial [Chrysochromulina tobinii]